VLGPEEVQLHVQVARALAALDGDAGDVAGQSEVLVAVGLVDEQVVDAGLLEGDPDVLDAVGERLQALLSAGERPLELLGRQAVT